MCSRFLRELELENDWPAIIQLQVHQTGAQARIQHVKICIRINFGANFSGIGIESAATAAAAATTAAFADAAAGASQTEPHLKHAPRLKDRPAYNALVPQQSPPLPHPSPFCFINLKPQTGCASRSPRQCRNKLPGREANLPVHHASAETSFPYGKPTFPFTTPVQKQASRPGSQPPQRVSNG